MFSALAFLMDLSYVQKVDGTYNIKTALRAVIVGIVVSG
jgi:hypothetical protein